MVVGCDYYAHDHQFRYILLAVLENQAKRDGAYRFLTTADPESFRRTGARFLQLPIDQVEHVAIAELERAAA